MWFRRSLRFPQSLKLRGEVSSACVNKFSDGCHQRFSCSAVSVYDAASLRLHALLSLVIWLFTDKLLVQMNDVNRRSGGLKASEVDTTYVLKM